MNRRATVWLVAAIVTLAIARVFVGAASFPFFSHLDEPQHVDRIVKVARGKVLPNSGLEFEPDVLELYWLYDSPAYREPPPPPGYAPLAAYWPPELRARYLAMQRGTTSEHPNHQVTSRPSTTSARRRCTAWRRPADSRECSRSTWFGSRTR